MTPSGPGVRPLRILIVAGYFPPYAPYSATRVNAMARYFLDQGHDIRVLAPRNTSFPPALTADVPADRITYTPIYEVLNFPGAVKDRVKRLLGKAPAPAANGARPATDGGAAAQPQTGAGGGASFSRWLLRHYNNMVSVPDPRIGWYPHAIRAGREILSQWRADLIYASAPPHTGLLVAAGLSRRMDVPWICEYRDLWVDHPYYDGGAVRRLVERRLEKRTLKSAAGFVTVTRTWADWLAAKHPQPVQLAMNGFVPGDYPAVPPPPLDPQRLTIIYAGGLYHGKRDPSPLFEALAMLGAEGRAVRIIFHGAEPATLNAMANRYGVAGQVEVTGVIPRSEVIARQCAADVLLLLRWDHPDEDSVLAGKLFEYIGARRPILSVGRESGEAADIIRSHGLGVVSKDPAAIAASLRGWIRDKAAAGRLPAPSPDADLFARSAQFAGLETFLRQIVDRNAIRLHPELADAGSR